MLNGYLICLPLMGEYDKLKQLFSVFSSIISTASSSELTWSVFLHIELRMLIFSVLFFKCYQCVKRILNYCGIFLVF